jgi:hypothetical protein
MLAGLILVAVQGFQGLHDPDALGVQGDVLVVLDPGGVAGAGQVLPVVLIAVANAADILVEEKLADAVSLVVTCFAGQRAGFLKGRVDRYRRGEPPSMQPVQTDSGVVAGPGFGPRSAVVTTASMCALLTT